MQDMGLCLLGSPTYPEYNRHSDNPIDLGKKHIFPADARQSVTSAALYNLQPSPAFFTPLTLLCHFQPNPARVRRETAHLG